MMLRKVVLLSMLAGLFGTGVFGPALARAELAKGADAPDIEAREWLNTDKPISLAELRGMVVVLYFWVSFHEGGERILPLMSVVDNSEVVGRRRGVYVMGVTSADRRRTEEDIKKAKIFFPVALESKSENEYEIESFPRAVIINAEGKVAWTGWPGDSGGDQMLQAVLDAVTETPPVRTHPREAIICERALEQTREYLAKGEFRQAYAAAKQANEHALSGDPLKATCQEYLDLLEAVGQDLLSSGEREIVSQNVNRGVEYLLQAAKEFRGMECSLLARKKLHAMARDRDDVRAKLDAQKAETVAFGKLAEAIADIQVQDFADAHAKLEDIVQNHGGSEAAEDARTLIARLSKHEAVAAIVRDEKARAECEPVLAQARNDIRAKRYGEAKKKLDQLCRAHADTSFAKEARKMLIELP
ncbi:MAG: redoxin domain-containing protein [Phycisphaerae bacterium]|nr:redoxin domain-containing protein [Phycisphaerae bacterium]